MQNLSIDELKRLIEFVALTVSSPETALDILLERLDASSSRVMLLTPKRSQYLISRLSAIAIDHIEEAANLTNDSPSNVYQWRFDQPVVRSEERESDYRIDAPSKIRLVVGDHVRFRCIQCPESVFVSQVAVFEALVEKTEVGRITFKCLRHPPAIYQYCLWRLENCGSFVTTQTMMEAVARLVSERESCCHIYKYLIGSAPAEEIHAQPATDLSKFNASQKAAVLQCLQTPVSNIWGPPGIGKTQIVVAIIHEILGNDLEQRLLVTAPTHNAVDNILRRYLQGSSKDKPVRVSTDVHKVSHNFRSWTCDAMLGKDINQHPNICRKAQKQVS